jgi:hypothetical protein
VLAHDSGFAWSEEERGSFRTDFFPPVDFPIVPHTPWVECNFPISPGIYEDVCAIVCKGNLTVLRRILYLDLAKGNPKLIYKWDWLMYNTCLAKGNPKRML